MSAGSIVEVARNVSNDSRRRVCALLSSKEDPPLRRLGATADTTRTLPAIGRARLEFIRLETRAIGELIATAANLSTRAIAVTRHRVCRLRQIGRSIQFFIPVPVNFTPTTRRALSTQRRAHRMTNVAATANVAAQGIIYIQGDKICPRTWINSARS